MLLNLDVIKISIWIKLSPNSLPNKLLSLIQTAI
jgi:hypothetical protein